METSQWVNVLAHLAGLISGFIVCIIIIGYAIDVEMEAVEQPWLWITRAQLPDKLFNYAKTQHEMQIK